MRIFGTGLSRTGTKSLGKALQILGYRTNHYPAYQFVNGEIVINANALDRNNALLDTPTALAFETLDQLYPGSKFVHTVREQEAWLASCQRFFVPGRFERGPVAELCRQLYVTPVFDRETFRQAYERQDLRVRKHFAGRERDLLVINICGGDGWERLCSFLDTAPPLRRPFPKIS